MGGEGGAACVGGVASVEVQEVWEARTWRNAPHPNQAQKKSSIFKQRRKRHLVLFGQGAIDAREGCRVHPTRPFPRTLAKSQRRFSPRFLTLSMRAAGLQPVARCLFPQCRLGNGAKCSRRINISKPNNPNAMNNEQYLQPTIPPVTSTTCHFVQDPKTICQDALLCDTWHGTARQHLLHDRLHCRAIDHVILQIAMILLKIPVWAPESRHLVAHVKDPGAQSLIQEAISRPRIRLVRDVHGEVLVQAISGFCVVPTESESAAELGS